MDRKDSFEFRSYRMKRRIVSQLGRKEYLNKRYRMPQLNDQVYSRIVTKELNFNRYIFLIKGIGQGRIKLIIQIYFLLTTSTNYRSKILI